MTRASLPTSKKMNLTLEMPLQYGVFLDLVFPCFSTATSDSDPSEKECVPQWHRCGRESAHQSIPSFQDSLTLLRATPYIIVSIRWARETKRHLPSIPWNIADDTQHLGRNIHQGPSNFRRGLSGQHHRLCAPRLI